jgi:osmotically-inducible protein OsmY
MKPLALYAAVSALSLGLAACNDPPADERASGAAPSAPATTPAVPASAAADASRRSAQVQLEADMALSSKVKEALQSSGRSRFEVAANDGIVTLYGTADTRGDKDSLALAAMSVEGVRSVVNNLVVVSGS